MDKQHKDIADLEKDKAKLNEEIKILENQFVSQYISLCFSYCLKKIYVYIPWYLVNTVDTGI